jgi:hypothetical protein
MEELCIVNGFNMKILYKWVVNLLESVKSVIFSLIARRYEGLNQWLNLCLFFACVRAKACGFYKSVSASLSGVIFNFYHTVIH